MQHQLREEGIRKWRATKCPLLTQEHVKKHLVWARAHQHWTVEDWKCVVWSDECAVQKDSNTIGYWVFQRQNRKEKYAPQNVRMKAKYGILSQMIWACFLGDKLGPIVFISGSVNQDVYIELLRMDFEPFVEALAANGETNLEFQHDNASSHTAKKTAEFLKVLVRRHGLTLMDRPVNSPDLSPIENLGAHLKLELRQRFPDTATLKGSRETIKAALQERLHKIWWDIGEEVLNDMVNGMPKLWEK